MAGASRGVVRMMLLCEGSHEGSRCGSVLLRRFGVGKATARVAGERAPARGGGGSPQKNLAQSAFCRSTQRTQRVAARVQHSIPSKLTPSIPFNGVCAQRAPRDWSAKTGLDDRFGALLIAERPGRRIQFNSIVSASPRRSLRGCFSAFSARKKDAAFVEKPPGRPFINSQLAAALLQLIHNRFCDTESCTLQLLQARFKSGNNPALLRFE